MHIPIEAALLKVYYHSTMVRAEGLAFCTVMQTIVTTPGTQANISNYYSYISLRLVLKYSKGNETVARKIMSTFFSSVRINPVWSQAIERFFMLLVKAQDEGWKQIQITQQAQQEIGNNILRSWEAGTKIAIPAMFK